jgi:hypothetical protein
LFAVAAFVFSVTVLPTEVGAAEATPHISVVDAGSSGSRIAVYKPGPRPLGAPTRVMEEKPKVPPLSDFEKNPDQAGPQGIGPLLDRLDVLVAAQGLEKSKVPVSVLATAGMRNVERRDPVAAAAIIASVRAYIPTRGYPVGEVGIMSGQREALYAWVDANAVHGRLGDADNKVGIVEVGGASAQVAFESPRSTTRGVQTISVGGLKFNVVALSYLGLGANDARMLMRESPTRGAECFPNNAPNAQPKFYEANSSQPLRASKANFQVKKCRAAYNLVIDQQGSSSLNRANNDRIEPTDIRDLAGFKDSKFLGVSSVSFNMAELKVSPGARLGARFQQRIGALCTGKNAWKSVRALYSTDADVLAEGLCANSEYVHEFA